MAWKVILSLVLAWIAVGGCAGQGAQQPVSTAAPVGDEAVEASAPAQEASGPACGEAEMAGSPGALASDLQADRVWASVRAYLSGESDLAGTFDIPGQEHGLANLERFLLVRHTDSGFTTSALFNGVEHSYEVEFALRGGCDLEVLGARLASVDGVAVSAIEATASR